MTAEPCHQQCGGWGGGWEGRRWKGWKEGGVRFGAGEEIGTWWGGDLPKKVQVFNTFLPKLFTKLNSIQVQVYWNIPAFVHLRRPVF